MRMVMIIFKMFFNTIIYTIKMNKMGLDSKYSDKDCYDYLRKAVLEVNRKGNVLIEATGEENIPKENGFIFFPNHQGLYDALGIIETCENPISVVIKKELSNTVIVKQVVACLRGQFIDRKDPRDGLRVIKQMAEDVKNGRNYIVFAEGTRTKVHNVPQEFHPGTFKSAVYAKCPIVPVALIDTYKPFDEKSIKKVKVYVHYLKPIIYEEYKDLKTKEIAEIVKSRIEEDINSFLLSNAEIAQKY